MPEEDDDETSIVSINLNTLDTDCQDQPRRMTRASQKLARLREQQSEAKANVALVRAETAMDVRRGDPKRWGVARLTDAIVKDVVETMEAYRAAVKRHIKLTRKVEDWEAVVNGLEHRKRMLELEVTLHGQGYFSAVRPKGAGREVAEEMASKTYHKRLKAGTNNGG